MKKKYKKPKIVVIEMEVHTVFATSCYIDDNSQGDFREDFNKKHRGTWGNLWSENDKK